jgi:LmbE family N-acetylglucosaminyl deacetylase
MKILVLSPHTDDMEFGCGGTVYKLIKQGHEVCVIVFSDCKNSLIENNMDPCTLHNENVEAMEVLGVKEVIYLDLENRKLYESRSFILEYLSKLNKERNFDMIMLPWIGDIHQDHKTVAEEALRAFRRQQTIILMYEIVAADGFRPNYFIPLSDKEIYKKKLALECYHSQKKLRKYFSPSLVESIAEHRGIFIMEKYAEAFELVRGKFDI